ncbi:hypothetical protein HK107_03100 [Parvularcula sp. ZS-1/3]|uniref:Uncharacterized protein n=1 Tax=Parvularcula mediterranea TaxID=2732508 RepID=A0A7Y3RL21_9PROT|nr:hypothetical protein [Parvularcula mediterranea]NNU15312.1 hypothetical protein [Parvularcula mediterranea]
MRLAFVIAACLLTACQTVGDELKGEPHGPELAAVRLLPVGASDDEIVRLLLGERRRARGSVEARCGTRACLLELRTGTGLGGGYQYGRLSSVDRTKISRQTFTELKDRVVDRGLYDLPLSLGYSGDVICLHPSEYYIETSIESRNRLSYFSGCHSDYEQGFVVAAPLLALALSKFPNELAKISQNDEGRVAALMAAQLPTQEGAPDALDP